MDMLSADMEHSICNDGVRMNVELHENVPNRLLIPGESGNIDDYVLLQCHLVKVMFTLRMSN